MKAHEPILKQNNRQETHAQVTKPIQLWVQTSSEDCTTIKVLHFRAKFPSELDT